MKILTPLNDVSLLADYSRLGAEEFYLGFYDETWQARFGKLADINRMTGFGKLANRNSFEEAVAAVRQIKDADKSAFITLNANCYSAAQRAYLREHYLPVLREAGADGVIVSDLPTALTVAQGGLEPVASTMCAIYNSDIANEYKQAGIRRMILPRDLSLAEIESIIAACPDVSYEVFFMRNGCIYADSYCLGMHRPELGATCAFTRFKNIEARSEFTGFADAHDEDVNNLLYNTMFHHEACAMCALYRLLHIGVTSLKIVGRADDSEGIRRDISLTAENLAIAAECRSEQEYLDRMQFAENCPQKCRFGFSCYYPEVRF